MLMVRGRRRDQWDRWGQLLSLVYNRTGFGEDFKPRDSVSFWPLSLINDGEKISFITPQQTVQRVPFSEIKDRVLGRH